MEVLVASRHANRGYNQQEAYEHCKFQERSAFQTDAGILPTSLKDFSYRKRSSKSCSSSSCSSPEARPPCANYVSDESNFLSRISRSNTKPISIKVSNTDRFFNEDLTCYELWAGPGAYTNSPPPSSLPIPNFSLGVKRTVSLDLPRLASDIELRPFAKSAPSSPTREPYRPHRDIPLSADSGTKTLRRIFNIEISDE